MPTSRLSLLSFAVTVALASSLWAVEHVTIQRGDQKLAVSGQILVEAADGGLLLESSDGVYWALQPDEIVARTDNVVPFRRLDKDELAEDLLSELGEGFKVHTTAHYVICYETSDVYAEWCGALYERLYRAFHGYWEHRDLELTDAPAPLPAIIFRDKASYVEYAQREFGAAAASTFGYYSLQSNRVLMYDLTGAAGINSRNVSRAAQVNQILMRPGAERTVATIVHEATHQIAFNCGMHKRYADIPLWVSEGVAMFFETPDLRSAKGWRTIGAVNRTRLIEFRRSLGARPANQLEHLLANDALFRSTETAGAAYPEAWALNYYLLKRKPKEYAAYLKLLAKKDPISYDTPEERIATFKQFFGDNLAELEKDYLRAMRTVR